ncbi:MAG: acyl-CoA dehydrogenase [Candidatus Entotheonella factor]|uniref:Short/branched chain specific acyl-CoA dehydrogenase, mitochondrial n=2 Tax=Candidatus Entotheonella TaxID=93171 RepID=W4LVQ5_ENTF1|nr:MAG: acyl-CoA dehydrogenase [Candidatus Entotheonella factor]
MSTSVVPAVQPLTCLSEEEALFRSTIRDFAETTIAPLVASMDETSQYDPALVPQLFELGLMGIELPETYGGAGGSFLMGCLAIEELSRVDGSVGVLVDVQNTLVNNALLRWCTPEQKAKYLPLMATQTVGSYALSEAGSGSDAFALQTRAALEGDHYVLNGRKLWITNGREAGLYIVMANVDPKQGYRGITAFLVEREFPGFSVGKAEKKLGIRASSTCELILDQCIVPKDNVLGEVGQGYKVAIETLNEGRIGIGAQMVGISQGALDAAVRYAKERQQFGRPIADFQAMRFQLAEMATELEAARLMVYNTARLKDSGEPFLQQAAMTKYFTSQVAERITSRAVEVFGGIGFTTDAPVEKFYRDAKIGKIYEGTSFMQLNTIAKQLLDD